MTRSYRKSKISSNGSTVGQKLFRNKENRASRRLTHQTLAEIGVQTINAPEELVEGLEGKLPIPKDFGNEWASPRDGKHYWDDMNTYDNGKYMRK